MLVRIDIDIFVLLVVRAMLSIALLAREIDTQSPGLQRAEPAG
jgi:hypothetical protein